jgi:hypothetical protein
MPARELTRQEMRAALNGNVNILREYTLVMRIVDTVDNQGAQCEFCGNVDATVAANVYATDHAHQDHCADTCLSCIVYVTDNHIDINPIFPVVVEIARGVR